ncbi:Glycosyltransferase, GT2 family [Saccharicrinis carchari]|uniref:Glycosyltransferase, GT2 family n=1 Tax=Saccharicrinis carchari TaxID=1168039 RepID=A0A521EPB0_SACCC|nr:glycosyltransferase family 2 protein [Saccharicrinis carchari]SMO85754.1 Glycosyltransferase, GT2 family [Saccharicrinis carchari]
MLNNTGKDHIKDRKTTKSMAIAPSVSFIIIGRNEGWRLPLCLKSTVKAIDACQIQAEIIYVDSQSTDDSLNVAKSFEMVKCFLITGTYNAAIARNIGVKEAQGQNLIFLDGDMEINPDFLNLILDSDGNLKYDFVSGNFMNYYYDNEGNFLRKDFYRKIYCDKDTIQYTTGGLFAIKRSHWESVGGMRNKYKKGQDLDLGYRLAKKGIPLLRKKERMANHHTIDYKDKKRLWRSIFDGSQVYPRVVLYRDNIFNKYVLKRMLTSDPTLILFITSVQLSLILKCALPMLGYVLLTALGVAYAMRKTVFKGYMNRLLNHILKDLVNLFALLFYYPTNNVDVEYERVIRKD